jgi:hypothetical protein
MRFGLCWRMPDNQLCLLLGHSRCSIRGPKTSQVLANSVPETAIWGNVETDSPTPQAGSWSTQRTGVLPEPHRLIPNGCCEQRSHRAAARTNT